ncbi:MAG: hypothetical protein JZD41_04685 [Thermoproteus sp.]|nr:hypothetical protein [Thermoproteus sp.]
MRLAFLLLLLLAAVTAAEVTIYAVDLTTGARLNNTIIVLKDASGNIIEINYSVLRVSVKPGSYLVSITVFGQEFVKQVQISGNETVKIPIPTAVIEASAIDAVTKRPGNWTVEVLGPDGSVLARGVGSTSAEVLAYNGSGNRLTYVVRAATPFGAFAEEVQPSPGQISQVPVVVPTAAIYVQLLDSVYRNATRFPIYLLNGTMAVAEGLGALKAKVRAGKYLLSYSVRSGSIYFNFSRPVELMPGQNVSLVLFAPTALVSIYTQTPLGALVNNATISVYYKGRLIASAAGSPFVAELAGNQTYVATASYGPYSANATFTPLAGSRAVVYINLSIPATATTVMPTPKTATQSASRTTTTTAATARPQPTTSSVGRPTPSSTAPSSLPGLYVLSALAGLLLALAIGVASLAFLAARRA